MIERIEFNPKAQQEVADSFDWYDSREVGYLIHFRRCAAQEAFRLLAKKICHGNFEQRLGALADSHFRIPSNPTV